MSTATESLSHCEQTGAGNPRVGYDARFSLREYRGMGRYLRQLLGSLPGNAIGFCASGEHDDELTLFASGFHSYPLWEQVSLPRRVAENGVEIFLAPYNTAPLSLPPSVKLIVVVHDLIYMRSASELPLSRSQYQNVGRLYRRWIVPRAVRRADYIVCVSEHTRQELTARWKVDSRKITVLPNTVDPSWYSLRRAPSDYVLCVSGEAPNKNLGVGLEGFAKYCSSAPENRVRLEIAGVKPAFHRYFQGLARRLGIEDRVGFLPYLDEPTLQSIYAGAQAFLFPSRDEGFGVPVLEALAAGVPVVAANASSIPEVAGSAALYFHPDAADEIAAHLRSLLGDPELQSSLSQQGRRRAEEFHPDQVKPLFSQFWARALRP